MIKLRDDEKKLILLIILVALVVFTIIFVDFAQTLKTMFMQKNEPVTSSLEQMVIDINLAPKNNDSAFLRESVSMIFSLMNEHNYENLYELLSKDFQEEIFDSSLDAFSAYMNNYASLQYTPKYTKYQKYGDTFVIGISFYRYTDDATKVTGKPLKTDTFSIKKIDENNFTFSFNGFIGKNEPNTTIGNEALKITLKEVLLNYSSSSFIIEFENLSDKDIVIPSKQIYVITGVKPKYYKGATLIPANSKAQIQFVVYTGLSISSALPNDIGFLDVNIDGKKHSFSLPIEYAIDV